MSQNISAEPVRRSSGTLQGLRKPLPWYGEEFRILSVDGGGIRGILPATVLAECEARFTAGRPAGDYFDMITGTSTGGIIALALAAGKPSSEIRSLYAEHGEEIFPARYYSEVKALSAIQKVADQINDLAQYRYEREPLAERLRDIFHDRTVGDLSRRVVIPSFDGYTEVNLFKTPHHPDYRLDWREAIVDVALATSAAPTFFSVYKSGARRFADGGVWANNPVMTAVVDALACFSLERRQIRVLSLGCVESEFMITEGQAESGGIWHWREIISSAMRLQSQNALGQAGLLIGRDHLTRIDSPPLDDPIALDDYARAMSELPAIGLDLVDKNSSTLSQFFDQPREPFEAFYGPRTPA